MIPQAPTTPHKTPLRRVSQGSLFALSRSGAYPDAPHGLGFLEPALSEFTDEIDTLQQNVQSMKQLSDSLGVFNESFASWLYIMEMNALTVDWPQAPDDASFYLAKRRAERDALAAIEEMKKKAAPPPPPAEPEKTMDGDTTIAGGSTPGNTTTVKKTAVKKGPVKGKKPKMSAKERKARDLELEKIVSYLPLEFRGSDPSLRRNLDAVVEGLMDAPGQSARITDLVKPPDLPQARVNKCLIALINRKIVVKDSSTGQVLYHWQGVAS